MSDTVREEDYFGEKLGYIPLQQLTATNFHHECAKREEKDAVGDNTGLRLYSGAHVAIRQLASLSSLLDNMSIIELGCGVGGMGLIGSQLSNYNRLVLTDAEQKTVEGAQVNAQLICSHCGLMDRLDKIHFSPLSWGNTESALSIVNTVNEGKPFDVVLGCELTYYRTDMSALVSTVMALTKSSGLFIHAHLFRGAGQEQQLIDLFSSHHWMTYELPHRSFISEVELRHHPEWFRMRALVSGPRERLQQWRDGVEPVKCEGWVEFREEPIEDDEEQEECEISIFR